MGTRYNRLAEAVLKYTHNICFEQNKKNTKNFETENCHFYNHSQYMARTRLRNAKIFVETFT